MWAVVIRTADTYEFSCYLKVFPDHAEIAANEAAASTLCLPGYAAFSELVSHEVGLKILADMETEADKF